MIFSVMILGSGSAVPTSNRAASSQLVECNGRCFLIDCGEGTQAQIRKHGIKFQRIDRIFISHLHGDHYFGLVGLLSTMHLLGRTRPVYIFGPEGLEQIVKLQLEAGGSRLAFDVEIAEFEPNTEGIAYEDEKVFVTYFPLKHKIATSGYRIEQKKADRKLLVEKARRDGVKIEYYHRLKKGENVLTEEGKLVEYEVYTIPPPKPKSYAYCSDTAYSEKIISYIKGVNVLYHEATFLEAMIDRAIATKHSTAIQAATIASSANVGKLLMGHLSARYVDGKEHEEEARTVFPDSEYVEDGTVYRIDE